MRTQFRLLAVTGALVATGRAVEAQSASSYFTEAPRVDVAAVATPAPALEMRDIVTRVPATVFAEPARTERDGGLGALRSEFGGVALHATTTDARDASAVADDDASSEDDDEAGTSASAEGGMGMTKIIAVLAGGGATWAAVASSSAASSAAAPAVSINPVGTTGPIDATNSLPPAELNPVIVNPEPSSMVLMATGAAGVALLVRRRRRATA